LNFVPSQKRREVSIPRMEQDREITPVDEVPAGSQGPDIFYEITKIGNHFRRAPGDVHRWDVRAREPVEDAIDGLPGHDFGAFRAGVHMAMVAGQIAEFAHIDLQYLGSRPGER